MEPQPTSPCEISGVDEIPSPPVPPVLDALPLPDAGSHLEHSPTPTPSPRSRHRRSQSNLLMELLSRRMNRQAFVQQNQVPSPSGPYRQPPPDERLRDAVTEVNRDEHLSVLTPPSIQIAGPSRRLRPSMRNLPLPVAAPFTPETTVDPDVVARVLARLQPDARPASPPSVSRPAQPNSTPVIQIDPSEKLEVDMEVDEGYGDEFDDYSWLDGQCPLGVGISGAMRQQGVLRFATSIEAAMRCPKLVRNIPRMRKRVQKKRKQSLRAVAENNGESSDSLVRAGDGENGEATSAP